MKKQHTNRLLLCMLLSLVVHTGLAATFFSAAKPKPIKLEVASPIEVSLVQNFADAVGTMAVGSTDSDSLQNSVREDRNHSMVPDEIDLETAAANETISNSWKFEAADSESVEPPIQSVNLTEPPQTRPVSIAQATADRSEPNRPLNHEFVDEASKKTDLQLPSTRTDRIEPAANQVRADVPTVDLAVETTASSVASDKEHSVQIETSAQPADVKIENKTDWNAAEHTVIREAEERPATDDIVRKLAMLGTSPTPLPPSRSENMDFDGNTEQMDQSDREPASIELTLDRPESAILPSEQNFELASDADEIAGLRPEPENSLDIVETDHLLASKPTEPSISKSPNPLASSADFELQIRQPAYAKSEVNELETSLVRHSDPARAEAGLPVAEIKPPSDQLKTESNNHQDAIKNKTSDTAVTELNGEQREQTVGDSTERQLDINDLNKPNAHSMIAQDKRPEHDHDLNRVAQTQVASIQPAPNQPNKKSQMEPSKVQQQAGLGSGVPRYGIEGLPNPAPRYPYFSRVNEEQGKVILRVVVDRKGRVAEIDILKSSGYSRLDKAARKAVKKWRFQPAHKNGLTVQGVVQVPISFVLENT